jgi:hypothetical protein
MFLRTKIQGQGTHIKGRRMVATRLMFVILGHRCNDNSPEDVDSQFVDMIATVASIMIQYKPHTKLGPRLSYQASSPESWML